MFSDHMKPLYHIHTPITPLQPVLHSTSTSITVAAPIYDTASARRLHAPALQPAPQLLAPPSHLTLNFTSTFVTVAALIHATACTQTACATTST
jgi:hypothetical protein